MYTERFGTTFNRTIIKEFRYAKHIFSSVPKRWFALLSWCKKILFGLISFYLCVVVNSIYLYFQKTTQTFIFTQVLHILFIFTLFSLSLSCRRGSILVDSELVFNNFTALPNTSVVTETLKNASASSAFNFTVNVTSIIVDGKASL